MKFTVSRLKRIEELILCEVISYARLDNALSDLRHTQWKDWKMACSLKDI